MESPVAIRDPDKPLGTLIFTAADMGDRQVRWNAVAIDGAAGISNHRQRSVIAAPNP